MVHSLHESAVRLLDEAIGRLSRRDDASVHAARKAAKRTRAALRLLRGSLGTAVYRRENRRVRNAARPLTAVRDAYVLRATLRHLPTRQRALAQRLTAGYRRERRAFATRGLKSSLRQLAAARARLAGQSAAAPEIGSLAQGVGRTYRAGRKAMARARSDDGTLHEWRKQSKYLLDELELLRDVFAVDAGRLRHRAEKLSGLLGEDHDLAVLLREIADPAAGGTRLRELIHGRRRELQRRAAKQGRRLYRRPAKHVEAGIARRLADGRRRRR